jgi:hypothetical protein
MSVTLLQMYSEVSKRCQETIDLVATGGSTTTFADTANLTHTDDYWAESYLFCTSGTNSGLVRHVQTFTASNATLTLYAALTASVTAADTATLMRRFAPVDLLVAINRSINVATPDFREHVRVDTAATADTYTYPVPIASNPDMLDKNLIGIEYGDTSVNSTRPIARLPAGLYQITEDYSTVSNANVKTLTLSFNPYTGYTIRFVFDGPLANVAALTDRVHLDLPQLEFLYSQAVAEMWRIEAARTTDANRKDALEALARAESFADRLRRQLGMERKRQPLRRTTFRVTGV